MGIECVHKSKQNLRVKAMHKKRHVDNHIEYLQGKRTYAETYEAPPKAHAYVEPWHDPTTPIWSRRSTRITFGSHHETNHSLYSVATNVLNLSDPFAISSLSLEASCQYSQLEQTHLSDI